MRHPGAVTQAAISLAMWPAIIVFSPVILLAGELVNRYVMRRVRWSAPMARQAVARTSDGPARAVAPVQLTLPSSLLLIAIGNPLWIALTAPARWAGDRLSRPPTPAGK
jgi:hypothetical protein